jgi:hypothetical protein
VLVNKDSWDRFSVAKLLVLRPDQHLLGEMLSQGQRSGSVLVQPHQHTHFQHFPPSSIHRAGLQAAANPNPLAGCRQPEPESASALEQLVVCLETQSVAVPMLLMGNRFTHVRQCFKRIGAREYVMQLLSQELGQSIYRHKG